MSRIAVGMVVAVGFGVTAVISWSRAAPAPGTAATPATKAKSDNVARKSITNSIGMKLVEIPAGEFMMGNHDSPEQLAKAFPKYGERLLKLGDELPVHKVRITKPFYLGATTVTIGQFKQFVKDANYQTEPEADGTGGWGYVREKGDIIGRDPKYTWRDPGFPQGDDHPVVEITWNDANAFCKWLSAKEGKTYRLPTEAEWEYAARAGSTTRYFFGDDPEMLAQYANVYDASAAKNLPKWGEWAIKADDHFGFTAPVGSFKPNPFGLYDVHGNVWQWCSDWYDEDYYKNSPTDDPQGPATGHIHVRRGACWHSWPLYLRVSFRNYNTPKSRYVNLGLRVVRNED